MLSLIAALVVTLAQPAPPSVVFVCAHGAAKSVIAATYFNKLAAERGLPYRATFRGVTPDADLSARALEGLKGDGLVPPSDKPKAIGDTDIRAATHIFAIGCTLPDQARLSGKADTWSDVPDDRGYGPMRDAIVEHVKDLLDRLAAPGGAQAARAGARTGLWVPSQKRLYVAVPARGSESAEVRVFEADAGSAAAPAASPASAGRPNRS